MISFLPLLLLLHLLLLLLLLLLLVMVVVTRLFLPRDPMHKHSLCCHPVSVCLSVCPSQSQPNFVVLFYLCVHPLSQNCQIWCGNTCGEGHISWVQPRLPSQESRVSVLSNFRGSPLFLPTPFNAEWPNGGIGDRAFWSSNWLVPTHRMGTSQFDDQKE